MKVLFIGGTGNISSAASRLCVAQGIDLFLLNRGITPVDIPDAKSIIADINNKDECRTKLKDHTWDTVVNWIAYTTEHIERDIELFAGKTRQYIFISSASVYQKPLSHPVITESTPLANPFWPYSQRKIACEEKLLQSYRATGFPATIVRPSLTYQYVIPVAIGSWQDYTIVDRMKKNKKIIVHGDGTSLWTITHAEDFARGFTGLIGHQQAVGHAFHITSDELLTWNQIYQALAEAAGVTANIVHIPSDFIVKAAKKAGREGVIGNLWGDKTESVIFDNTKIKAFVPGFTAVIPFKQGIKRTLEWYQADPARMKIIEDNNTFTDSVIEAYEKAYDAI